MALWPRPLVLSSIFALSLASACGGSSEKLGSFDANGDGVPDELGAFVDANGDGFADTIDINHDGVADGPGIDSDGDGKVDQLALDTDCDGIYESADATGDGRADFISSGKPPVSNPTCKVPPVSMVGSGGSGAGGSASMGGSGSGGMGPTPSGTFGTVTFQGQNKSTERYAESDTSRNGVGYKFIANGWGDKWQSHEVSWFGTSFKVLSLNGSPGMNYAPAGYPSMFCGLYSQKQSEGMCGLPKAVSALQQLKTGWRWKANGNSGQYNAAWDIWLGNSGKLSAYLMVWLRDPPGQQPAGRSTLTGATVAGLPGTWNIWTGNVNGLPIVNYVKAEGQDLPELEYDVLDVYKDAINRQFTLPGSDVMAVAVGFEIWSGPITDLSTEDFYVDVK
jgi:hypothetical protein